MNNATTAARSEQQTWLLQATYALFAISPCVGFLSELVAIVILYDKRDDIEDPRLAGPRRICSTDVNDLGARYSG